MEVLDQLTAGVSPRDAAAILGQNAAKVFHFDLAELATEGR